MNDDKSYYYNPWEIDLLNHIGQAKSSVYIIAPFIKLSIIKKIITSLYHKSDVKINLCSRFDKNVFTQKSSDLEVFEVLLNHPVFSNRISLFKMNKLHAKVYIIDEKIMFISSSNLSYAGLNSSYEIAIKIENTEDIKGVIDTFNEDKLFHDKIDLTEINYMGQVLKEEKLKTIKKAGIFIPRIESHEESENVAYFENNYEEEIPEVSTSEINNRIEDNNRIIAEINTIINRDSVSELNIINGYEFESVKKSLPDNYNDLNAEEKTVVNNIWSHKAQNDLEKIRKHIKSIFELYDFDENKFNNLLNIFIDNSWKNKFKNQINFSLNSEYYFEIGNLFINFYIRQLIVKGRYFHEEQTPLYDDTYTYIIQNYPYKKILESLNLNLYLHIGQLKSTIEKNLFISITGFLIINLPYDTFINFFDQYLNHIEDFVYDDYFELNYKSRLQELTQNNFKQRPEYCKISEDGPDHNKTFFVKVFAGNKELGKGTGHSLQEAEKEAAKNGLEKLTKNFNSPLSITKIKKLHKYELPLQRINSLSSLRTLLDIKNIRLLDIALTHPSVLINNLEKRSYKKLAYLGSYLERFILSLIYFNLIVDYKSKEELDKYKQSAGQPLPKIHHDYFVKLELDKYLHYNLAGKITSTIQSDTIQSLIAVQYFDKGFNETKIFIEDIWKESIESYHTFKPSDLLDHKTKLQQIVQSKFREHTKDIIEYKNILERRETDNTITYIVDCLIDKIAYGRGRGSSKKKAQMDAAKNVLENFEFKTKFLTQN